MLTTDKSNSHSKRFVSSSWCTYIKTHPSLCEIMLGAFPLTYAQVHIKSSRVVKNDLKSKRADMALLLLLLGHISPILVEDLAMIETHPQY